MIKIPYLENSQLSVKTHGFLYMACGLPVDIHGWYPEDTLIKIMCLGGSHVKVPMVVKMERNPKANHLGEVRINPGNNGIDYQPQLVQVFWK